MAWEGTDPFMFRILKQNRLYTLNKQADYKPSYVFDNKLIMTYMYWIGYENYTTGYYDLTDMTWHKRPKAKISLSTAIKLAGFPEMEYSSADITYPGYGNGRLFYIVPSSGEIMNFYLGQRVIDYETLSSYFPLFYLRESYDSYIPTEWEYVGEVDRLYLYDRIKIDGDFLSQSHYDKLKISERRYFSDGVYDLSNLVSINVASDKKSIYLTLSKSRNLYDFNLYGEELNIKSLRDSISGVNVPEDIDTNSDEYYSYDDYLYYNSSADFEWDESFYVVKKVSIKKDYLSDKIELEEESVFNEDKVYDVSFFEDNSKLFYFKEVEEKDYIGFIDPNNLYDFYLNRAADTEIQVAGKGDRASNIAKDEVDGCYHFSFYSSEAEVSSRSLLRYTEDDGIEKVGYSEYVCIPSANEDDGGIDLENGRTIYYTRDRYENEERKAQHKVYIYNSYTQKKEIIEDFTSWRGDTMVVLKNNEK